MGQNLFEYKANQELLRNAPLADRMRPRTLDEFEGQQAILAEGRLLRRAINTDRVGNLLLHGPPGVGKTTLARIIASQTRAHFSTVNAVLAGIKDLRKEVEDAKDRLAKHNLRSILFIDEVHRFNTAQQDALLPWVENGTVTLIGATTENPYFEVNKALLSRSRLFRLQALESDDLHKLLSRALNDTERGYGARKIEISKEASNHLVDISNGDARCLLNALELAVESTIPDKANCIKINIAIAEESIQERAVLYDKQGDAHYDTISAFIKSLRGSDADAALFWLARMIEAGESPRFIFRRMLIAAAEDIGLADPQAIVIVEACAAAFERVGLPEGLYHLSQAALYLACAEKSNSLLGFFEAIRMVRTSQKQTIPSHLRDASRDKDAFGDGIGYKYPHAFKEHWVSQQYLPKVLQGEVFWQPSHNGWEGQRRSIMLERKAAQLAVIEESSQNNELLLSSSPESPQLERWLQRQMNQAGERMYMLGKKLWADIQWNRQDRVLILGGQSLLWALEPLKKVQEGGVTIISKKAESQSRLLAQIDLIEPLHRPKLINGGIADLDQLPDQLKFEWIGGRISKEIFDSELIELLTKVSEKSHESTEIRFLITHACIGPAASLIELMNQLKIKNTEPTLLKELAIKEKIWLKEQRIDNKLEKMLNQLGWKIKWEQWSESLTITLDKELAHRWLGNGNAYYELVAKNYQTNDIQSIKGIIKDLHGEKLPQRVIHQRMIGTR